MNNRPKIIVLCGSSKFVDIMAVTVWILERDEGAISMGLHTFSPGGIGHRTAPSREVTWQSAKDAQWQ